jgi:hypothetical protein
MPKPIGSYHFLGAVAQKLKAEASLRLVFLSTFSTIWLIDP